MDKNEQIYTYLSKLHSDININMKKFIRQGNFEIQSKNYIKPILNELESKLSHGVKRFDQEIDERYIVNYGISVKADNKSGYKAIIIRFIYKDKNLIGIKIINKNITINSTNIGLNGSILNERLNKLPNGTLELIDKLN